MQWSFFVDLTKPMKEMTRFFHDRCYGLLKAELIAINVQTINVLDLKDSYGS